MEMKKAFFDHRKVTKAVDRQSRRSMSRSLAFVRRRLRSTYRRRKRASKPGQAPSVHSRDPVATLKNVLFAYDHRTKSGVVGSVKLNGQKSLVKGSGSLPGLLESGGTVVIPEESWDGQTWRTQTRRRRVTPGKKTRRRQVSIAPRPAASVALEKEKQAGNIASPWANVVTG